jgi:hypothetical protein
VFGQDNDLLHLTHHCASLRFSAPQLTQVFIVCAWLCAIGLKPQYGQGICAEYFPHLLQNGMFREVMVQGNILLSSSMGLKLRSEGSARQ